MLDLQDEFYFVLAFLRERHGDTRYFIVLTGEMIDDALSDGVV